MFLLNEAVFAFLEDPRRGPKLAHRETAGKLIRFIGALVVRPCISKSFSGLEFLFKFQKVFGGFMFALNVFVKVLRAFWEQGGKQMRRPRAAMEISLLILSAQRGAQKKREPEGNMSRTKTNWAGRVRESGQGRDLTRLRANSDVIQIQFQVILV